ncbi:hypothetical protein FA10DRAFT_267695 [Acaromyces ingoldii]|uniref:Sfi1 spindle body domain-containing protein n=1 Tax=Acaromyces ingoldii TaxID=215250 RepID=A0A316YIT3_9BASI|nr:hypothetical protein FA10DRAFT_267695 [Acaromyces ingoldii]PWN89091.1 hypothetical protein FA10DRAFT_267695 [Acaromyces ingoldii]
MSSRQHNHALRPPPAGSSPMYAVAARGGRERGGLSSAASATPSLASSTATSSRFSLSTAFVGLSERDVDFFDEVIDLLPQGASDFASLKRAYNTIQASQRDGERGDDDDGDDKLAEERDAYLWDTLLRLIQVRGKDWNQRWDAVRMAIGLEPRVASDGEATSASLGDDESSPAKDTSEDDSPVEETPRRYQPTLNSRDADASPSVNALLHRRRDEQAPQSQSQRSGEIEALRARMEQLSAQAGSLVAAATAAAATAASTSSAKATSATKAATSDMGLARRQLRFADEGRQARVESASDDEAPPSHVSSRAERLPRSQSELAFPARHHPAGRPDHQGLKRKEPQGSGRSDNKSSNSNNIVDGLNRLQLDPLQERQERRLRRDTATQRRFEDVVARSRSEREAQRQADEARKEAEEEETRRSLYRKADSVLASTLTRKCLTWWTTLYRQHQRMEEQTRRARDEVVKAKALVQWRTSWQKRETRLVTAGKLDLVRCQLRAWRRWIRMAEAQRQQRREARRSELRGAFEQTRSNFEAQVLRGALDTWRDAFLDRVARRFRQTHLLSGALALWRIQLERSTLLDEHEQQLRRDLDSDLLRRTWQQWTVTTTLSQAESRITTEREHRLVQESWQLWRRKASLSMLANTFANHRLQRAYLLQWSAARASKASVRRKEALADRWRARRSKRSAFGSWVARLRTLQEMDEGAAKLVQWRESKTKQTCIKVWVLREREELLRRVTSSRVVTARFQQWLGHFRSLRDDLEARQAVLEEKRRARTMEATFASWRHVTLQVVASQSLAAQRDCRKVRAAAFNAWRDRLDKIRANERKAEVVEVHLTKRKAFGAWTEAVRRARLEGVLQAKDVSLLGAAWAAWRDLTAERQRERLAVAVFQARADERLSRSCLTRWTAQVIDRRAALLEAGDMRDGLLVRRGWDHWVRRCQRHEDRSKLCKSFVDVKREESARRIFHHWLASMRMERVRREKVDAFQKRQALAKMRAAWDAWYDRLVETSLRPIENAVLDARQQAAMARCLAVWERRTDCLPAIRFHQALILSHALFKWRDTLPLAQGKRVAEQTDRRAMFAKAFYHWMDKAKTKRKLRAAARFGGPSAAARLRATTHQARRSSPFSSSPDPRKQVARQTLRPRRSSSVRGQARTERSDEREETADRIRELGWTSSLIESADLQARPTTPTARRRGVLEEREAEPEQPLPEANTALHRWRSAASRVFSPPPEIESISEPSEVPTAPSSVPTEVEGDYRLPFTSRRRRTAAAAQEEEIRSEGTVMKINRSPRKRKGIQGQRRRSEEEDETVKLAIEDLVTRRRSRIL